MTKNEVATSNKYIVVGRIKDAHNLKGEVFVRLDAGHADWFEKLEHVELSRDSGGSHDQKHTADKNPTKTLKVLKKRPHKNGLILALEGPTDRTAAEALKGYEVAIPEDYLIAEQGEALYLRQVRGFKVIDAKLGAIGDIDGFATNTAQDLLVVHSKKDGIDKENLIPFVQDFIETIDFDRREVHMNLPEGLIEMDPKV